MHFVAINDPLAAGLEAIDPTLKTSKLPVSKSPEEIIQLLNKLSFADESELAEMLPSRTFDHIELRDDRVTLFAEKLRRGVHTYTYYARAITCGTFVMPPSTAEKMYQPEVFGRTGTARLIISEK